VIASVYALGRACGQADSARKTKLVSYAQAGEPPIHPLREEFRQSARDPVIANDGLKLADELIATVTTLDPKDARRLIKLVRDLLDTVELGIERQE
jgi:hypothetical protein